MWVCVLFCMHVCFCGCCNISVIACLLSEPSSLERAHHRFPPTPDLHRSTPRQRNFHEGRSIYTCSQPHSWGFRQPGQTPGPNSNITRAAVEWQKGSVHTPPSRGATSPLSAGATSTALPPTSDEGGAWPVPRANSRRRPHTPSNPFKYTRTVECYNL